MRRRRVAAAAIWFIAVLVATASAQEPAVVWTLRVPDARSERPFVQSASNDRCLAVLTATAVHVVSMTGETLWSWRYRESLPPIPEADRSSESCEPARDGVTPLCLRGPDGLVITSRGTEIRAVRQR